jgi:hypothetical protein
MNKNPLYHKAKPSAAWRRFSIIALFSSSAVIARAQDQGNAGIQEATTLVQSYFTAGCTLLYAIGAIVGLIGAIKVYNAWSHGDPNTNKLAAGWFSGCIFLVVVASVLKSFFLP